jgi:acyl-CoA hydrolase
MSPGAKASRESATEMVQLVLPNDANVHGTVLGGTVMHWMDMAAAITAHRHARCPVVTVSVDSITFEEPIRIGQVAILKAHLTFVGRTSMEICVEVDCEDLNRGTRHRTSQAYFTFVALDEAGKPRPVPGLRAETEAEKQEMEAARERRARRLTGRESSPRT